MTPYDHPATMSLQNDPISQSVFPGKHFRRSITQHSSLLDPFLSYEDNEVLQIWPTMQPCGNLQNDPISQSVFPW